jgi:hypothetical protein
MGITARQIVGTSLPQNVVFPFSPFPLFPSYTNSVFAAWLVGYVFTPLTMFGIGWPNRALRQAFEPFVRMSINPSSL